MKRIRPIFLIFIAGLLFISCAKKVPPVEPFDAEKSFGSANKLIAKKKYDEARRELYDIRRRETEIKYSPLAQLRIGDSYRLEDAPEAAVDEYRRFLKEYPKHKYAAYAQYQIAKIYFSLVKDAERGHEAASRALEEFEKLNDLYPRNLYRAEAEGSMDKCRGIIAEHEYMVGVFYFRKEAWKGALERFAGLRERFPEYEEPEVLYRMAASYKNLGEAERGRQYLELLLSKYPGSKPAKKAKKEFDR